MSLKTRFKAAIEGLQGKSFQSVYSADITARIGGIDISKTRISTDALFTSWRNHGDVYAVIRELSQNVASSGYKWVNIADETKDPDITEVKLAETYLNYGVTFNRMKRTAIRDEKVTGNAFFYIEKSKSGKPLGLKRIDPRTLTVVTDSYGDVVKWIQRVKSESVTFAPEEIVHWKEEDDPNSPVFGMSALETIIWEVRSDLAALISNYVFFQNDAKPSAMYILEEGMSDKDISRAVKLIEDQLKGAENRHKSLIMEGIKDIKTVDISQKDMEFHVLRKFETEKICAAYGVPKSILGYVDNVNLANGKEQTQQFWDGTIIPIQENFQEFINKQVLPAFGIKKIKMEMNARKFDDRQWDEASSRADLMLGVKTINEAREERGYEPFDATEHGEFVDKPIIYQGLSAKPVEDVGVDMTDMPIIDTQDAAQKEIERMKNAAKMANMV